MSFVRSRGLKRWNNPNLRVLLEPDEQIEWADLAFSGILGHPRVQMVSFVWGSTLWDVALTDRRFLAVQFRLLPNRSRKILTSSWNDVSCELNTYSGTASAVLTVRGNAWQERFKLANASSDYAGIERVLRKHIELSAVTAVRDESPAI